MRVAGPRGRIVIEADESRNRVTVENLAGCDARVSPLELEDGLRPEHAAFGRNECDIVRPKVSPACSRRLRRPAP